MQPENILTTAANLLDRWGTVAGHFVNHEGRMCVHGAINQAEAVLEGKVTMDDKPELQPNDAYITSMDRSGAKLKAVQALVDAGYGAVNESIGPWAAGWANNLIVQGRGNEVIAALRSVASGLERDKSKHQY